MTNKQDIRKMLRQRKPTGSSAEASAIISRLAAHPQVVNAHTLLLYSALPDEIPTQSFIDGLIREGKNVLLPRVVGATTMELRQYTGANDLQEGAFGIMEPTGELFTNYAQIDVAIVPGMAFDREGHRLGRGKGYYDRFLPLLRNAYKIGICYSSRLLDHVPTGEYDICMDEVITTQNAHQ